MNVLVLNAGSSSLKASLVAPDESTLAEAHADWSGPATRYTVERAGSPARSEGVPWRGAGDAVKRAVADVGGGADAVGHRVVHGGPRFTAAVRVTDKVRTELAALSDLAPLHNPPSLAALAAAEAALPGVPHVAAFDTQFHATLAPSAFVYPVPFAWTHEWGVRRYGFHGLSHAYCAARAAELVPGLAGGNVVVAHLGHGASLCAVAAGKSVDTTMGFTPLDGLMMGTRSGSVDPGVLLYALREKGLSADDLDRALNRESGLLGVSGVSADMREVLAKAAAGHADCRLAFDVYVRRVRQGVAEMAAALGGLDTLVFTAGVGEHSAEVRAAVCEGLGFLGVALDRGANGAATPDADVALDSSRARVLVVATREDLTIAREVRRVVGG